MKEISTQPMQKFCQLLSHFGPDELEILFDLFLTPEEKEAIQGRVQIIKALLITRKKPKTNVF